MNFDSGRGSLEKKGLPRRNSDRFSMMEDNYILSGFKPAVTTCSFIKQVLLAQFRVNRIFNKNVLVGFDFIHLKYIVKRGCSIVQPHYHSKVWKKSDLVLKKLFMLFSMLKTIMLIDQALIFQNYLNRKLK